MKEDKKVIIPIIPTQQNKIIISNIADGEEKELEKFLIEGVEDQVTPLNSCFLFFRIVNFSLIVKIVVELYSKTKQKQKNFLTGLLAKLSM